MRIIAGNRRGAKLAAPTGLDARPTADRVRESLFNILDGGRFGIPYRGKLVVDAFGVDLVKTVAECRQRFSACGRQGKAQIVL